jgi:hypothetical protein
MGLISKKCGDEQGHETNTVECDALASDARNFAIALRNSHLLSATAANCCPQRRNPTVSLGRAGGAA